VLGVRCWSVKVSECQSVKVSKCQLEVRGQKSEIGFLLSVFCPLLCFSDSKESSLPVLRLLWTMDYGLLCALLPSMDYGPWTMDFFLPFCPLWTMDYGLFDFLDFSFQLLTFNF